MIERTFDKVFGAVIWGFMLFAIPFCSLWWSVYMLNQETPVIALGCILGVSAGIAFNIFFLKKLAAKLYTQRTYVSVLLLVLYSVGIFGFFMGVPVFNLLAGALAAIYVGRQAKVLGFDSKRFSMRLKKAQSLLFLVFFTICAASAYLALSDPHTAANLEGMFSLGFPLTKPMLLAIILSGGTLLLVLQAAMVKGLASFAYRR